MNSILFVCVIWCKIIFSVVMGIKSDLLLDSVSIIEIHCIVFLIELFVSVGLFTSLAYTGYARIWASKTTEEGKGIRFSNGWKQFLFV